MFPEYLSLLVHPSGPMDLGRVTLELERHLSQRLIQEFPKQARSIQVRAHRDFDAVIVDLTCERRELIGYAQVKEKWTFFSTLIREATSFLKVFGKDPLITCYSDKIDIGVALRRLEPRTSLGFRRNDLVTGCAIRLTDLGSFYYCTCEGASLRTAGSNDAKDQGARFLITLGIFACSHESCLSLATKWFADDQSDFSCIDSLYEIIPIDEFPDKSFAGIDTNHEAIWFVSGKVFFEE